MMASTLRAISSTLSFMDVASLRVAITPLTFNLSRMCSTMSLTTPSEQPQPGDKGPNGVTTYTKLQQRQLLLLPVGRHIHSSLHLSEQHNHDSIDLYVVTLHQSIHQSITYVAYITIDHALCVALTTVGLVERHALLV